MLSLSLVVWDDIIKRNWFLHKHGFHRALLITFNLTGGLYMSFETMENQDRDYRQQLWLTLAELVCGARCGVCEVGHLDTIVWLHGSLHTPPLNYVLMPGGENTDRGSDWFLFIPYEQQLINWPPTLLWLQSCQSICFTLFQIVIILSSKYEKWLRTKKPIGV